MQVRISETQFKEQVQRDLKDMDPNGYYLKTQERGRKGVPDMLICLQGDFVAIELKRDGEVPTKLQQLQLDKISRANGTAFAASPETWDAQLAILKGRYRHES
jgi:hypothetical protein